MNVRSPIQLLFLSPLSSSLFHLLFLLSHPEAPKSCIQILNLHAELSAYHIPTPTEGLCVSVCLQMWVIAQLTSQQRVFDGCFLHLSYECDYLHMSN